MADVTMPQLGETVTEGTITKWFKQVGEQIAMDEVLFEVSTDKVDSEVPSPVAGYLTEIRAAEGDTVEVGEVIAVVGDEPPAGGAGFGAPSSEPAPEAAAAPDADAAPAAVPQAPQPAPPAAAAAPSPAASSATEGLVVSPVVRRLIAESGIDVSGLVGTGIGGRITRADVEAAIAARPSGTSPASPPDPAAPPPAAAPSRTPRAAPAPRSGTGDTVEPFNNIRRRTGDHMRMSIQTSPHAYTIVEVDYEGVDRVRRTHKDQFEADEGFSLTYLPFITRAVIDALRAFPHLNASVSDEGLVVHNYANIAIAVDLDFDGLLAPVIHDADDKRLRAVARDIRDLATRARTKALSVDDISGGTFTISNSGSFGTHLVLPIINQPQVAILSTDGITRKPVVVTAADGTEAIAIHSVGMLGLSWDHRAFDGAYAAAFLAEVKHTIETRDWDAEL
jgi:2-oxoglutarate dehydrogenase E2 component (dihydrolipoamide succinyltransferase)